MSRRREVEAHRVKLGEIRNIMNSMKMLANMETHKLARVAATQAKIVASVEAMAMDFLHFYLPPEAEGSPANEIILLLGSERGFCGNFNESLVQKLDTLLSSKVGQTVPIIAMGHKLRALLEDRQPAVQFINGANVVEESEAVLQKLLAALSAQQSQGAELGLSAIYHVNEHELASRRLLPPFSDLDVNTVELSQPPLLNLPDRAFYIQLIEHYLLAVLHQLMFSSLMAENALRIQHLDGAVRHLDDKSEELIRRSNALRQEEIIEEIEVILLNASSAQLGKG